MSDADRLPELHDVIDRLRHSVATASNDDLSEPMTEQRKRHTFRITAMSDAIALLEGSGA